MNTRLALFGLLLTACLAMASPAAASSFTCNGSYTGAFDNVTVPADGTCTLIDSTVKGKVDVEENAYFEADHTSVGKDVRAKQALTIYVHDGSVLEKGIDADRTAQVFAFDSFITEGDLKVKRASEVVNICGMKIDHDVEVKDSGRDILIGDPLTAGCAGNKIGHDLKVEDNATDVELVIRGNKIGHDLTVKKNRGSSDKVVEDNRGGHKLDCKDNQAPFFESGNTGWDEEKGQCD